MKEKKNIDKIFQQGLENLDLSPSPQVWENIRAELEKKKSERKVIPLWMRLGGVAAGLALLLTVGNLVFNSFQEPLQEITNEHIDNPIENTGNDAIPSFKGDEIVSTDSSESKNHLFENATQNQISTTTSQIKRKSSSSPEAVSADNPSKERGNNTSQIVFENRIPDSNGKDRKSDVAIIEEDNPNDSGHKAIAREDLRNNDKEESETSDKRPSLIDAIAEQNSITTASKKSQTPENRWSVTPNLAPVYYSSFGNGSSIDPEFASNPQKGDVNMSYGVQVSYAINNKLSIRTGLNNVDLSYSTADVLIATGPVSRGLKAVAYGNQSIVVTAVNKNTMPDGLPNGQYGELNLKSTLGDARVIQELNYFEIPLELQYTLIDRKIGLNLIGGVSTLLLGENEISVKSDNFSDVLGPANNLSNVSFATNLGIGLNYRLSKRFRFNLEPTFKYQLNPYTDASVDFRPYYLGVYSGLSIKF